MSRPRSSSPPPPRSPFDPIPRDALYGANGGRTEASDLYLLEHERRRASTRAWGRASRARARAASDAKDTLDAMRAHVASTSRRRREAELDPDAVRRRAEAGVARAGIGGGDGDAPARGSFAVGNARLLAYVATHSPSRVMKSDSRMSGAMVDEDEDEESL